MRLPSVAAPEHAVWVFDLDNTLYPASCNLFDQVSRRMTEFVADYLKLPHDEARALQKQYFRTYGTTLRGLMTVHGMDAAKFLDYVHEIDVTPVEPSTALDRALTDLPGRKLVFTNGSVRHAENVLGRLGVARHFEGIFDIVASGYVPKPDPAPYAAFLRRFAVDPAAACMFEDIARNLVPAAALGMTTVLVAGGTQSDHDPAAPPEHVHHVTQDLASWLAEAAAVQGAGQAGAPQPAR